VKRVTMLAIAVMLLILAPPAAAENHPPPDADAALDRDGGSVTLTEFEAFRDPAPISEDTGATTHRNSGRARASFVRDLSHDDRGGCPLVERHAG